MPTVQTDDLATYYESRGSGPPVVFVHGAIVDHTQWAPQAAALADEYTTISYDLRGHGRTGGSDRDAYSVELFADDLRGLCEALGVERPVVCGLSLGGAIAQVYAARHPDRLAGLVLADTFGPEPLSRGERLQRRLLVRLVPLVRLVGYEWVERAMVAVQERFDRGVSGNYGSIERIRAEGPRMATDEFDKVVRALAAYEDVDVDLSTVAVPSLVLYGANEASFIRLHVSRLASTLPDATVREVPGGGHASNLDNPDFVTDALREFLAGVDWSESRGPVVGDA
ncbi:MULTISPECIES: alpha/beta fold hydrolase [Salinibaculum]|uniref:alpha/beta fold hydrolase n=1 Tax=Salinibaculum TaxID=2732368 RepID=UPI0030D43B7A